MTLPSEVKAALREIKYKISVGIVERRSEELDCTPEEYGKVYDSEKHELMLNKIIRSIQPEIERLVVEAERNVIMKLVGLLPAFPGHVPNFDEQKVNELLGKLVRVKHEELLKAKALTQSNPQKGE